MDVQKYIKRLKFARADMSRATGPFETRDEAIGFLNSREFFFGDPFVIKYKDRENNGEVKLMLAIGKSENPTVSDSTTEVSGGMGPEAYELFDMNELRDAIEKLREDLNTEIAERVAADEALQDNIDAEASARTAADEALQEQIDDLNDAIDAINDAVAEMSGATEALEEIVGEGWTDSPDNVTITDRIKRDEKLAGIVWGHNDGEPYDGHLPNTELPYASGESIPEMINSISDVLDSVLFEDEGLAKAVKFEYNPERNILYYTAGTETGAIELSQAAVVDDAYYDSETEELVIVFKLGEGKEQEVRIPVGGLIAEWGVENTDTIELAKTRVIDGSDVLTANVKVSDDADNMLVAKSDGLYVSNSGVTKIENDVEAIKEDLGTLPDGHFPADYFSGSTVNGSSNIQDAILKLDEAIVALDGGVDELEADLENTANTLSQKIDAEVASLREDLENTANTLDQKIDDEIAARENVELVEIPAANLEPDVRAAYVLSNNGNTGSTIIRVYKDSHIYRIYIGHVDDQITSPTDPTVIPGTGDSAICFIYFNANGEYALTANAFDMGEAFDELVNAFNESEEVTSIALNRLAEAISEVASWLGEVEQHMAEFNEATTTALTGLTENVATNTSDIAELKESSTDFEQSLEQERTERVDGDAANDMRSQMIQGQLDDEKEYRKALKLVQLNSSQIISEFGQDTNVKEAYFLTHHKPNSTEPYTDPQPGDVIIKVYKDPVYSLNLDPDAAVISLNWTDENGQPRSSSINVSDFTKDSFLENVQVITRDGVNYLEFRFKTYDGEPVPIYVPLEDLAVIYSAGDGIDREALENDRVITVKIDEFGSTPNFLAKSANGIRVTGVTEAIQEAIDHADFSDYVKKSEVENHLDENSTLPVQNRVIVGALNDLSEDVDDKIEDIMESISGLTGGTFAEFVKKSEVEDHFDSASTLPVQNKVVTEAINELREDIDDVMDSLSAFTATTVEVESLTAVTANIENLTAETIVTNEITGDEAYFSGLTANTIYADEYQNLPTATTEQYGVVILDEQLDSASTNPVENKVIWQAITDVEESVSEALDNYVTRNEFNSYTASTVEEFTTNNISAATANFENLTAQTIYADEYYNLPTATTDQYGLVIVDDQLDSASTNPVENRVLTKIIIEDELVIAAAFNDLNDRKADIEDIPVSIYDLEDSSNIATKSSLAGYLPLSGGTMTGNISGSTGNAIYMPGGFFQQSDETLKIFMGDIENALDKANQIPTKYFYWKDRYDGPRELGTSAQKVQEFFPEIVSGDDKLSVDYSKLAIVALAAIKELTAKVEDLQNQLNELKK